MSATPLNIAANPACPHRRTSRPATSDLDRRSRSRCRKPSRSSVLPRARSVIIDGERIMTTDTERVVEPHAHQSVIGTMATADQTLTKRAIAGSLEAQHGGPARHGGDAAIMLRPAWRRGSTATSWSPRRWWGSPRRSTSPRSTPPVSSRTSAFNVHLAQQIYGDQPASLPGDINILDQRPLEDSSSPHSVQLHRDRRQPAHDARPDGQHRLWKPSEKAASQPTSRCGFSRRLGCRPGSSTSSTARAHRSPPPRSRIPTSRPELHGLHHRLPELVACRRREHGTYRSFPAWSARPEQERHPRAPDRGRRRCRTALVRAAFEFQGQKCSAASRAYIARSSGTSRDELVDIVRGLPVGDPTARDVRGSGDRPGRRRTPPNRVRPGRRPRHP